MLKQLIVALTAEGSTDRAFLVPVIRRILESISLANGSAFEVEEIIWLGAAKGDRTLTRALEA